ncbi:MAG: prepilin-type N-terminal cleavage/methylation domain-containing protein [candidate division Zixibacteria bacterium]|nr:prepilin-type N-terminal cleavage/methylation domain-containing protein [candidate division Zixibacteria bacterium]
MFKFLQKNRGGFTLVEVLVVLIIIAVLAAIAVPIYLRYVESARAAEAQEAIGSVLAAAKIFQSRWGNPPTAYTAMAGRELTLDPLTLSRWNLTWTIGGTGRNRQVATITATSTGAMPGGAGKLVIYNAMTGEYTQDSYGQ